MHHEEDVRFLNAIIRDYIESNWMILFLYKSINHQPDSRFGSFFVRYKLEEMNLK